LRGRRRCNPHVYYELAYAGSFIPCEDASYLSFADTASLFCLPACPSRPTVGDGPADLRSFSGVIFLFEESRMVSDIDPDATVIRSTRNRAVEEAVNVEIDTLFADEMKSRRQLDLQAWRVVAPARNEVPYARAGVNFVDPPAGSRRWPAPKVAAAQSRSS
jgi:hypothetical protein